MFLFMLLFQICPESDGYHVLRLSLTIEISVTIYYYAHLQPLFNVTQSVAIPDAIYIRVR